MRAKPHEVKMMMIDPKMVELNVYNGIPHLLAPVVTDPKKASQALKKVVNEMERRYELFSHTGTRNIEGYNDYIKRANNEEGAKQPELPYIVVIVDELADLMMVASSDVEDSITRLSQMARAAADPSYYCDTAAIGGCYHRGDQSEHSVTNRVQRIFTDGFKDHS